ncbi:hypothetical protein Psal071_03512 (plasmid) [Piscirickettsia salmonis]|uniref:Uncharacterized protein n=1 Tax=Piscirickettsia salmonis TaxID=1238 RepID=A0A9Q6LHB9_PISSA|nr:hypothetical protein [Piscirickettsia salmonis]QGN96887.1 hypothetical protein Psal006a_03542 [Piscirickettsia salmonis]QGO04577.1 hypothetical protein Psal009_00446 [Piscirickettsia salmonis]QGO35967.1 hypothetical protein Psal028_03350 [Piscirickettsia salmonis]QGO39592.1 hypothetical protein Psal040_03365 [Piscirickettsia salmonis]QGO46931.1 hypothetical protein Psal051_03520 [Piscirickettsia salmonis]
MPKMIFTFDLDQTLLCHAEELNSLNSVYKTCSHYDPYEGAFKGCYTLQKEAMKEIIQDILKNGNEIAFITAGSIKKQELKQFFQTEYSIDLGEHFQHYYDTEDKTSALKQIANNQPYFNTMLIDNNYKHVNLARKAGFRAIYVDNNCGDLTDGTQHIQDLQKVIHEQAQEGTRQYYSSASPKTMHYSSQTTKSLTVAERERELVLNKYKQEHKQEKMKFF